MGDQDKYTAKIPQIRRTFGQKAADKITSIVGSWQFIIIQSCLLTIWIILNVVV